MCCSSCPRVFNGQFQSMLNVAARPFASACCIGGLGIGDRWSRHATRRPFRRIVCHRSGVALTYL